MNMIVVKKSLKEAAALKVRDLNNQINSAHENIRKDPEMRKIMKEEAEVDRRKSRLRDKLFAKHVKPLKAKKDAILELEKKLRLDLAMAITDEERKRVRTAIQLFMGWAKK